MNRPYKGRTYGSGPLHLQGSVLTRFRYERRAVCVQHSNQRLYHTASLWLERPNQGKISIMKMRQTETICALVIGLASVVQTIAENPVVRWDGNGHCYQVVDLDRSLTWFEARSRARDRGGYLATLTSAEENEFVFQLIKSSEHWTMRDVPDFFGPWIGGVQNRVSQSYREPAGGWEWVNGEPFSYSNWAEGEPNEADNTVEDFLFFYGRTIANSWADESVEGFNVIKSFVVEYEPSSEEGENVIDCISASEVGIVLRPIQEPETPLTGESNAVNTAQDMVRELLSGETDVARQEDKKKLSQWVDQYDLTIESDEIMSRITSTPEYREYARGRREELAQDPGRSEKKEENLRIMIDYVLNSAEVSAEVKAWLSLYTSPVLQPSAEEVLEAYKVLNDRRPSDFLPKYLVSFLMLRLEQGLDEPSGEWIDILLETLQLAKTEEEKFEALILAGSAAMSFKDVEGRDEFVNTIWEQVKKIDFAGPLTSDSHNRERSARLNGLKIFTAMAAEDFESAADLASRSLMRPLEPQFLIFADKKDEASQALDSLRKNKMLTEAEALMLWKFEPLILIMTRRSDEAREVIEKRRSNPLLAAEEVEWLGLMETMLGPYENAVPKPRTTSPPSTLAQSVPTRENKEEAFIEGMELKSMPVGALRIYYDNSMAGSLDEIRDFFENFSAQFEAQQAQARALQNQSVSIIQEVNRLIGWEPDADYKQGQRNVLNVFLTNSIWSLMMEDSRIFLINKEASKQYLREGGTIPGIVYHPVSDKAEFELSMAWNFKNNVKTQKRSLFVLPVDNFEELEAYRESLENTFLTGPGVTFHELIEVTLFKRLEPQDPTFRWFSDGFANALSERLLRKFIGPEAELDFQNKFSVEPYRDLQSALLLRYWMGAGFCVETGFESETRLTHARYSFATLEARRLIDDHGEGIVAKAIDLALADPPEVKQELNVSRRLLNGLQRLTGEDLDDRFRQYEPFDSLAAGLQHFQDALAEADAKGDDEAALSALLRLLELKATGKPMPAFEDYQEVWVRLKSMGRHDESFALLEKCIGLAKEQNQTELVRKIQEDLVQTAWELDRTERAETTADALLVSDPDNVKGLSIQMERLSREANYVEARIVGEKIIQKSKEEDSLYASLAQFLIGTFYVQGHGVPKDLNQAREWFERSAVNGNAGASKNLATLHLEGIGGPRDPELAFVWMKKAAELEDPIANWFLGKFYIQGVGVEKNPIKAVEHIRFASERGLAEAQQALGQIYWSGEWVERDVDLGISWLEKAGQQGQANAQWLLAQMYMKGEGVNKDMKKAIPWLEKAAWTGVVEAQTMLGVLSYMGDDIPKDISTAYKWLTLAADSGHENAQKFLDAIASEMSAEELVTALRELSKLKARMGRIASE